MAIFIVLWPYLLTTKLRSVIRHNLGHSKVGKVYILFFCCFSLFSFFVFSASNSDLVQPQLVVVEATKAMLRYTMVAVEYQYSLKVTTDLVYATAPNLNLTEMPF